MTSPEVVWHDLECGVYAEDLRLWRELAGDGPVLDLGCGTGRVAIDLATRGVPVVGLDHDPALLAALAARAKGLPVETVCADARAFDLGRRFGVVLAPMQTVQLLGLVPIDSDRPGLAARLRALDRGDALLRLLPHLSAMTG